VIAASTYVRRYSLHDRDDAGGGHLSQGRYKHFPAERGAGLLNVLRYIEPTRSARAWWSGHRRQ
jgi:hypothetical protein